MNPMVRNILAVVAGLVIGGLVNIGIVSVSGSIIPPPEGVDPSNVESIKASMHLYETKHYILPFLAHALGTLAGAILAVKLGVNNKMLLGLIVGAFFLIGGIMAASMLPAPLWFEAFDIIVAYIPMGWLGYKLGVGKKG